MIKSPSYESTWVEAFDMHKSPCPMCGQAPLRDCPHSPIQIRTYLFARCCLTANPKKKTR